MNLNKILRIVGILMAGAIFAHTVKTVVSTFPYGGQSPVVTSEE
jgi:hypothetical protein